MRTYMTIDVVHSDLFKKQLLMYIKNTEVAAVYDSCNYYENHHSDVHYQSYDFLAGIGELKSASGTFSAVEKMHAETNDWYMGYMGYDLKNELEKLYSVNHDELNFPLLYFFQPRYVICQKDNIWKIGYLNGQDNSEAANHFIHEIKSQVFIQETIENVSFKSRVGKEKYCQSIDSVLDHIHRGDIYELNYCMEFYANDTTIDPYQVFNQLTEISPTPFASFLKIKDCYVLSASPERYLKKEDQKLISQPIKGTVKRGVDDIEDEKLKNELQSSIKEQSENIMIVDLVRNDLSRVAASGSVAVEELCGIYPFRQVFQMITTVVAQLNHDKGIWDAIKSSFPMGSMTGAPKIRAMKLIEKYEETKRGVYSGAVGYFSPEGDFDFNVVIRSLLYNATNQYLSFMVGSAITEKSIAEIEYDECLLKAKALLQLFNQTKPVNHD